MIFKKLLPTGAAVAACFLGWSTASAAQSLPAEYAVLGSNPELNLTIDLVSPGTPNRFKVSISALDGSNDASNPFGGDLFGFAFNIKDPNGDRVVLDSSDFTLTKAIDPKRDPTNVTTQVITAGTTGLCYSAETGTNTCPSSLNFNGDGGGNTIPYDYIYQVGTQGGGTGNDGFFLNMVEFEIDATHVLGDLGNPFRSLLSARVQTTVTDQDGTPQTSFKADFTLVEQPPVCTPPDPNCPSNELVPEIDGPVLIQVGFALGGLYLLLLGRRREEDELAHAA